MVSDSLTLTDCLSERFSESVSTDFEVSRCCFVCGLRRHIFTGSKWGDLLACFVYLIAGFVALEGDFTRRFCLVCRDVSPRLPRANLLASFARFVAMFLRDSPEASLLASFARFVAMFQREPQKQVYSLVYSFSRGIPREQIYSRVLLGPSRCSSGTSRSRFTRWYTRLAAVFPCAFPGAVLTRSSCREKQRDTMAVGFIIFARIVLLVCSLYVATKQQTRSYGVWFQNTSLHAM
ncbi:Uncharacterized protein Rs2_35479 [Raphanus sativus]|nr:Uncharacterized protein Rs2_35479 [Raphanus sativus]